MDHVRRHKTAYAVLRKVVAPYLHAKFPYRYDSLKNIPGPYLLLVNHTMELDPVAMGLASPKLTYFVASDHISRKGMGSRFLKRYLDPIMHAKGKAGIQTTMEMLRRLRAGYNVCLFPEGNRCFNGCTGTILPNTGKLARKSGAGLVTYKLVGGYFTNPRWASTYRKGLVKGTLVRYYSPEELKAMSDDEVQAAVERDLWEDAYEVQKSDPMAFKGKELAKGLDRVLFVCPSCGSMGTLETEDDEIFCACGFAARYDAYGILQSDHDRNYTIRDWDLFQRQWLRKARDKALETDREALLFRDFVTLYRLKDNARDDGTSGNLEAGPLGFRFNSRFVTPEDIAGLALFSSNFITIHLTDGAQYEIRGSYSFCALKYLYLYKLQTGASNQEFF